MHHPNNTVPMVLQQFVERGALEHCVISFSTHPELMDSPVLCNLKSSLFTFGFQCFLPCFVVNLFTNPFRPPFIIYFSEFFFNGLFRIVYYTALCILSRAVKSCYKSTHYPNRRGIIVFQRRRILMYYPIFCMVMFRSSLFLSLLLFKLFQFSGILSCEFLFVLLLLAYKSLLCLTTAQLCII